MDHSATNPAPADSEPGLDCPKSHAGKGFHANEFPWTEKHVHIFSQDVTGLLEKAGFESHPQACPRLYASSSIASS